MKTIHAPKTLRASALALIAGTSPAQADTLGDLNTQLARVGLPAAGSADMNAMMLAHDQLTFSIKGFDGVTRDFTITDNKSEKRAYRALQASNGYTSIHSRINGNTLTRSGSFPSLGTCSGPNTHHTVSDWPGSLNCLGVGGAYSTAASFGATTQIPLLEFQYNRPTTEFATTMNFMRTMRQSHNSSKPTGGSSGADQYHLDGDLGLFISAGGSFGSLDGTPGQVGSDVYRRSTSIAADYRISDSLTAGFIFNYVSSSVNFYNSTGSTYSDIFRFAPYLSYIPFENAFIDFSAGYGRQETGTYRYCPTCIGQLHGDFGSNEGFGSLNFGYVHNIGGVSLTGYGQTSIIGLDIGGYRETGPSAATNGVIVGKNGALSVTTTLGTELSYAWSTSHGVVVPRVFGEWVHEYENMSRGISLQLQNGGLGSAIQSRGLARDWGNLGAGAQFLFPNSISAFVNYQSLVMTGASNHTIEGGVKLSF